MKVQRWLVQHVYTHQLVSNLVFFRQFGNADGHTIELVCEHSLLLLLEGVKMVHIKSNSSPRCGTSNTL